MDGLFAELARRASSSARREVDAYAREIPEFGILDVDARARAETLEYAVWLRRRTGELAPTSAELTPSDLTAIAAMGESRAASGLSLDSRQRVLRLHTALMLREVNEATDAQRDGDPDELVRLLGWFAAQGERGIEAYCQGFVAALRHRLPYMDQVALLVRALLAGDPMADELARAVGMRVPDHCAVTVIRVPSPRTPGAERDRGPEGEVEALIKEHQVPLMWSPPTASTPGELIALTPLTPAPPATPAPTRLPGARDPEVREPEMRDPEIRDPEVRIPEVLDLIRDFAQSLPTPCAAGTTTTALPDLPTALDRARRISRAAPLRRSPARPHTTADVFVELAVADVPFVDAWLHTLAHRLAPGPDLLLTLDAYYTHDMNRTTTATALNVHPRTLDYRLRRVRELTGIAPGSTRGVRVLSSVVRRGLSGAWGPRF
ncbi:helix-turn-helix domain-containing protein [Streptomyces flavofungini]|uniref:Helix-turn-helix domain-containing protein n=1 Tax=Streptomyces flavofungini TaxID=68200 RepID=A0ABS0WXU8_9ACTN|nr:helix-turn-helix domain-containing protein [Streptomyces flavofungini]MBJ3805751.1 helix-turn-helix domain-containing protein [Streptomyces flavofungini]